MRYRELGKTGVLTSVIGLGTNRFGSPKVPYKAVERILLGAIDSGVNLIDTADYYQKGLSEAYIGKALAGKREKVLLASKFYYETGEGPNERGASRYHMMNSLQNSLTRLGTNHIDLYYIHRWDAATPIEESLRALDDCVRDGKVRYIGASSFAAWQLARANLLAEARRWTPFVVLQSHYHMFERTVEKEILPYCRELEVGFIPYYPLAGGILTGKYKRGQPAPTGSRGESNSYVRKYLKDLYYDRLEQLEVWAEQKGHALTDLALAWLLAQPAVCAVIPGASMLEQFEASLGAADWELSEQELDEVEQIISGVPEIHHDLGKRLGIRAGMQAALINAPEDYPDILGALPEDVAIKKNLSGSFDFIQVFARTEDELGEMLPKAGRALRPGGSLWITYPADTAGEAAGLKAPGIRELCSGKALSESRSVQVDDTWTAIGYKKSITPKQTFDHPGE